MSRTIDYDAFRIEQAPSDAPPPVIKIGGVEYPLAPSIPAIVATDLLRIEAMDGPDMLLTSDAITTMGTALFGAAWRTLLIKHQIALAEVPDLIRAALGAYADDPKAKASRTSQTAESSSGSSKRGRGSKPTSSANIRSTS